MKNLKTFESFMDFFKSDKSDKILQEQRIKNEEILREIYKMSLSPDKFVPNETWLSKGDIGKYGSGNTPDENDKIITNWNGISLSFDVVTKEYEISISPKFKDSFKDKIEEYIKTKFMLKHTHQTESYTRTIKFEII